MKRSIILCSLFFTVCNLYSQFYEIKNVIKTGYGLETGGVGLGYEIVMDRVDFTYSFLVGLGYFEDNLGVSAGAKIFFIRTEHFNMSFSGNYGVVDIDKNNIPEYGMYSMLGSSYTLNNGIYVDASAGLIPRGNTSGEMTHFNPAFQMSVGFIPG